MSERLKELTLKQIEEAANFLSHAKTMKRRDNDMDKAFAALVASVGRLIEIVQCQQLRIDRYELEAKKKK